MRALSGSEDRAERNFICNGGLLRFNVPRFTDVKSSDDHCRRDEFLALLTRLRSRGSQMTH